MLAIILGLATLVIKQMKSEIKYIELKSGYHDDGPAWIGMVEFSEVDCQIGQFRAIWEQRFSSSCLPGH